MTHFQTPRAQKTSLTVETGANEIAHTNKRQMQTSKYFPITSISEAAVRTTIPNTSTLALSE